MLYQPSQPGIRGLVFIAVVTLELKLCIHVYISYADIYYQYKYMHILHIMWQYPFRPKYRSSLRKFRAMKVMGNCYQPLHISDKLGNSLKDPLYTNCHLQPFIFFFTCYLLSLIHYNMQYNLVGSYSPMGYHSICYQAQFKILLKHYRRAPLILAYLK